MMKITFLKLKINARITMHAAEQGPKQESIQDWNIYWNIKLLCETHIVQKQKKNKSTGFTEMFFFCRGCT